MQRKDTKLTSKLYEIKKEQDAKESQNWQLMAQLESKLQKEISNLKASHKKEYDKLMTEYGNYRGQVGAYEIEQDRIAQ